MKLCAPSESPIVARYRAHSTLSHGMTVALLEGVAGAKAMAIDVTLLMWLRTVMNRQFRHGGSMLDTVKLLYQQGGVPRFYSGFPFAIVEGPLSRGVGAAANYGTLHVLNKGTITSNLPLVMKTALSSLIVASFRLVYYPLDTAKTISQVEGSSGLRLLREKIKHRGITVLYHGASTAILGAAVKHTIWFTTYNYLSVHLPTSQRLQTTDSKQTASAVSCMIGNTVPMADEIPFAAEDSHLDNRPQPFGREILQNSFIGLSCAVITNILSNPLAVLKAYKQTHTKGVTYTQALSEIVAGYGIMHLFRRGITTRLWGDALNSIVFTVLWRMLAPEH
eukprot:gene2015-5089_t